MRWREFLVTQRTKMTNALRAHLAEHGYTVAKGVGNVQRLAAIVEESKSDLPELVREMGAIYLDEITRTSDRIDDLRIRIKVVGEESDAARRLQTMPGIGPVTAMAIETLAPPMEVPESKTPVNPGRRAFHSREIISPSNSGIKQLGTETFSG